MRRYRKVSTAKTPAKNKQGRYFVAVTFDDDALVDFNYLRRHLDEGQAMTHSGIFAEALARAANELRRRERRAKAIEDAQRAVAHAMQENKAIPRETMNVQLVIP